MDIRSERGFLESSTLSSSNSLNYWEQSEDKGSNTKKLNVLERSRALRRKRSCNLSTSSSKKRDSVQTLKKDLSNIKVPPIPTKALRLSWQLKQAEQHDWAQLRNLHKGNHLNITDITELRRWFDILDTDKSGQISIVELADPMLTTDIVQNEKQLLQLFHSIDKDGSGEISFDEFSDALGISKLDRRIQDVSVTQNLQQEEERVAAIAEFLEKSSSAIEVSTAVGISRREFILSTLMALKGDQILDPLSRKERMQLKLKNSEYDVEFLKTREKYAAIKAVIFQNLLNTEVIIEQNSVQRDQEIAKQKLQRQSRRSSLGRLKELKQRSHESREEDPETIEMRKRKKAAREAFSHELRRIRLSLIKPKKKPNGVAKKFDKTGKSKVLPIVLPRPESTDKHLKSSLRAGVEIANPGIISPSLIHNQANVGKVPVPKFPAIIPTSIDEFSGFIFKHVQGTL